MKALTKILAVALLTTLPVISQAKIFVPKVFVQNWTQIGISTSSSSSTSGWLHTSEVNGICTYSYNISGTTYGPFTETNNQCNGSLFTSNVNGINHTTVKVNGVVVYQD